MAESVFTNRKLPRNKVDIAGFYNYSNQWYPCTLYDLSSNGAGLKINQFFVPGDIIRLKFGLGEDLRVVESTVSNVNGTRIGVRFLVDAVTKTFLQHLIDSFQRPAKTRRSL